MSDALSIGTITITYEAESDGDLTTRVSIEGELPFVTQLGLLEMAKDTLISGAMEDD